MDIEYPEIDLLRTCQELGTAVVAYSPLGRGFLTGAIKSPESFEPGDFRATNPRFSSENFYKNLKLVDELKAIAERKGCTSAQLILAFLLAQSEIVIPIPGTTRAHAFDENMGALVVKLAQDEMVEIRKAIEATEVHGHRYNEAGAMACFVDTVPLRAPAEK